MRKAGWAIFGAAALLVAVALLDSGDETGQREPAAVETRPATPAEPAVTEAAPVPPEPEPESEPEPEGLTAEERAWLLTVGESIEPVGKSLGTFGDILTDDERRALLLLGHQDTVIQAAAHLVVMQNCSATVERNVAAAPTARLKGLRGPTLEACRHIEIAADKFARGFDSSDAALIEQAATSLTKATLIIERVAARTQVLMAGG